MQNDTSYIYNSDYKAHYLADFYEIVSGRTASNLGIKFELIHSDPPGPF